MSKQSFNKEVSSQRYFYGTLIWGIIINLTLLFWFDSGVDCVRSYNEVQCTPYAFYLMLSLLLGWIVNIITIKLDQK